MLPQTPPFELPPDAVGKRPIHLEDAPARPTRRISARTAKIIGFALLAVVVLFVLVLQILAF